MKDQPVANQQGEQEAEESAEQEESEEQNEDSMFEYELESNEEEEEKKEYDYDYSKEEFFNPVIVKSPDGTISIGTESKNKDSKEALCWNCHAHLVYNGADDVVKCYSCK